VKMNSNQLQPQGNVNAVCMHDKLYLEDREVILSNNKIRIAGILICKVCGALAIASIKKQKDRKVSKLKSKKPLTTPSLPKTTATRTKPAPVKQTRAKPAAQNVVTQPAQVDKKQPLPMPTPQPASLPQVADQDDQRLAKMYQDEKGNINQTPAVKLEGGTKKRAKR